MIKSDLIEVDDETHKNHYFESSITFLSLRHNHVCSRYGAGYDQKAAIIDGCLLVHFSNINLDTDL